MLNQSSAFASTLRVCVVGAGPSGITAAKNCLQVGITPTVYEKNHQVGGNWIFSPRLSHSSVFETTHIISSKRHSNYDDYPMPAHYPDYPSHKQMLDYFQSYARDFGVTPHIRFNTDVQRIERGEGTTWRVTVQDADGNITTNVFDYVMVANGHHWNPQMPSYPGNFAGEFIHSHNYKTAAPYKDKRVLVIGGGNSACDIAVETSRVSAMTAISMRRGYHIILKFGLFGQPPDVAAVPLYKLGVPFWIRNRLLKVVNRLSVGDYRAYGLERPKHGIMQGHIVNNSELLYFLRHGKIQPRKDIARFDGNTVHFVDGKSDEYDTVIAATGFHITFPFFDPALIDFSGGKDVPLYLRAFSADHPTLFFIGLVQPLGCIWPLADLQSRLAANHMIGNYPFPPDMRERIAAEVQRTKSQFYKSTRHTIEVEGHEHEARLRRELPPNTPKWGERSPSPAEAVR